MNKKPSEEEFLASVKTSLRTSEEDIDELTVARLRAARRRAVSINSEKRFSAGAEVLALDWLKSRWRVFAVAMALSIMTIFYLSSSRIPAEAQLTSVLEDIELLSSSDDFELYRDLDFYLWMNDENISG